MRTGVVDRAGSSRTGQARTHNEDSYLLREPLFMVADGMGGAQAGEIASRMAAEAFAEVDLRERHGEAALRKVIEGANAAIHARSHAEQGLAGMGTTVTALLVGDDGRAALANVGDSRAYLLRDGELRRLSEDHSLVAELVRAGHITEEQADSHPQRNVITRVLGSEDKVQVDTFTIDLREGDVLLLCTDGLSTMVPEARIADVLSEALDAERAARKLVSAAADAGGADDATAVVVRIGAPSEEDEQSTGELRILEDERGGGGFPLRALVIAVIVVVLAAGAAVGAVLGLRASHFVGADERTGHIAVFQGVPVDLFAGIKLYHVVYESPVTYASLDPRRRKELFDHTLRSDADARALVHQVEEASP